MAEKIVKKSANSTATKKAEVEEVKEADVVESKDFELTPIVDENEKLKAQIAQQSEEFAKLKAQLELLTQLMSKGGMNQSQSDGAEEVAVGCRVFSGLGMVSADGTQTMTFRCGEKKYIEADDLRSYLRESIRNNKALFSQGLLYFYNEDDYARFKVKKVVDLSEDHIIDIITMSDTNDMIRKVSELTSQLRNDGVTYTFKFMIAEMLVRDSAKLRNFTYENRVALEDYLGVKFDTLIANANMYRTIRAE